MAFPSHFTCKDTIYLRFGIYVMQIIFVHTLEIITQQIEQSRRDVSRRTGQSLFVAGLCTMGMAIVVAAVNLILFENGYGGLGHLLWLLLPAVIWLASRQSNKDHEPAPVSIIGKLVGKTWLTFAIFALGFFIFSTIWNYCCPVKVF